MDNEYDSMLVNFILSIISFVVLGILSVYSIINYNNKFEKAIQNILNNSVQYHDTIDNNTNPFSSLKITD
jgi:preprotein translocase subunit YajC